MEIEAEIATMKDIARLKAMQSQIKFRLESLACSSFGIGSLALITINKRGMGSHICYIVKAPGGRSSTFNIVLLTELMEDRRRQWRVAPESLLPLPENRKEEGTKLMEALKKRVPYLFDR